MQARRGWVNRARETGHIVDILTVRLLKCKMSRTGTSVQRKQVRGCQGMGRGEMGRDCLMGMGYFSGVTKKVLKLQRGGGLQHCESTKCY